MSYSTLLNALIVDPASESRSTLKDLLLNDQLYQYAVYREVTVMTSLEPAQKIMTQDVDIDVVFISLRFSLSEIAQFIVSVKTWDTYGRVAFVLVCNAQQEQDRALVAQGVAIGANAFLLFPCSIDQLRNISTIAQKIKIEADARMIEAALRMLVDSLILEIETKVEALYDGGDFHQYSKHLRSAVRNILDNRDERKDSYLNILQERMALARPRLVLPPKRLPKSKLLREKMLEREAKKSKTAK